jgi:RsiW-degrading membrane proteinase PrsW (M82 family)
MAYAASALIAGHLFQTFADGLELTSFDAIAMVLVMWLLAIILMLEVEMARDLAGHELIQDLLVLRSQRLNLTVSKRSAPMKRGKQ